MSVVPCSVLCARRAQRRDPHDPETEAPLIRVFDFAVSCADRVTTARR